MRELRFRRARLMVDLGVATASKETSAMQSFTILRLAEIAVFLILIIGMSATFGILLTSMPWVVPHVWTNAAAGVAAWISVRRGASFWTAALIGLVGASLAFFAIQVLSPSNDSVYRLADVIVSALLTVSMTLALIRYSRAASCSGDAP